MYIKGVGMTRFGLHDRPTHLLMYEAASKALADAAMTIKDIDAVVISNIEWFFNGERQRHAGSLLSGMFKISVPIIRTPAACGGGGAALWTAKRMNLGNTLVIGVEKLMSKNSEAITHEFMMAGESQYEQREGLNFPSQNALVAQEYLRTYPDTTMDDLALIALKNHENAFNNPLAFFYKKKVSLEKIKKSPIVASPLRLFDCSVSVDGSAAVVLTNDKTDVSIAGSSLQTDFLPTFERESLCDWSGNKRAVAEAYKQADIEASDIDVAEIHDAFTIVELMSYEDLGFAKKGQGVKLIRDGTVTREGKLPVNPCGGLKAKGHPPSATGLAQVVELTNQLRGVCGDRQVNHPKYGLAQNVGGAGGTVVVNILKKAS